MWRLIPVVCLLAAAPLLAQQRDWGALEARFDELCEQGDYPAARALIVEALEGLSPDEDLHRTGTLLWFLGLTDHALGDIDVADLRYRAAISALERAGLQATLTLAHVRLDYASLIADQGTARSAERLRLAALEVLQRELGPDHPDTLRAQLHLASSYLRKGDRKSAERLCREVIASAESSQQFPVGYLAESYHMLGMILQASGHHAEAAAAFGQSLALLEALYGPQHPIHLNGAVGLARAHISLGQFDSASDLLTRAESVAVEALGTQHPVSLQILSARCELLRAEGKTAEAKRLEKSVRNLAKTAREQSHSVSWAELTGAAGR